MGNDQVRFDLTVAALGAYTIEAPVRELQQANRDVREFEKDYLRERGHEVRDKTSTYTINENLLGVTISGAEIDRFDAPGDAAWQITAGADDWPGDALTVRIEFEQGVPVALDGEAITGPALLAALNRRFGAYGVGRGLYTGDTTIGLKGRVAFEAPAIAALHAAPAGARGGRQLTRAKCFQASRCDPLGRTRLPGSVLRAPAYRPRGLSPIVAALGYGDGHAGDQRRQRAGRRCRVAVPAHQP